MRRVWVIQLHVCCRCASNKGFQEWIKKYSLHCFKENASESLRSLSNWTDFRPSPAVQTQTLQHHVDECFAVKCHSCSSTGRFSDRGSCSPPRVAGQECGVDTQERGKKWPMSCSLDDFSPAFVHVANDDGVGIS